MQSVSCFFFLDRFISAFCQLVLVSWKPRVIQYEPSTCTHLIFPSVYQMLVGLIGSFGSFVYNMSEYHILSDNVPIAPKVILKFWLRSDLQMLHNVTFLLGYRSSTEADGILFHSFSVQVGTTLILNPVMYVEKLYYLKLVSHVVIIFSKSWVNLVAL